MVSEEVVNEVEESREKGGFEETGKEKVGKGFEAGWGELLVGGIEIIEVLVKTGGVLEADKDLSMDIGDDFVGKILEHGERVSETAADGFKGVMIGASFEESFGRGVSTGTLELKIGCLTEAVDLIIEKVRLVKDRIAKIRST